MGILALITHKKKYEVGMRRFRTGAIRGLDVGGRMVDMSSYRRGDDRVSPECTRVYNWEGLIRCESAISTTKKKNLTAPSYNKKKVVGRLSF